MAAAASMSASAATGAEATAGAAAADAAALTGDRKIVAFCCRECAYAAADASANARTPLPPTVRLVLMPCTGRVSPLHLLKALAEGADGVMVAGCLLGQCHYREGNFNAVDRVAFVQRLLKSVGVEPERCRMFTMSAGEPPKFVAAVREMDRVIGGLPPLPRSVTVHRPAVEDSAKPVATKASETSVATRNGDNPVTGVRGAA